MSNVTPLIHEPALAARANHLLRQLPIDELDRVRSDLEPIDLALAATLYRADEPIEHAYFPLSGVGSIVATTSDGRAVEVTMTGRDGIVGLPLFFGQFSEPLTAIQQIPGCALRMRAAVFCREMDRRSALFDLVQRYAHAARISSAQTVACNRLHNLEERAARWLLMTRDRVDSDRFGLTHEFLATMLGVHRPSVTLAVGRLQTAGVISYQRAVVTILDRERLEEAACECYRTLRDSYTRLLGDLAA